MRYFLIILFLSNLSLVCSQTLPLLLLVSFDGFRYDYPKLHGPLKNFQRLAERGVHAQSMTPTFATATFPNHYTLITGLYEETHGLISNHMYDPKTNVTFEPSENMTDTQWWPFPTIWAVNEKRTGARSGVVGWPQDPVYIKKYESFRRSRSFRDIVDKILSWFNDPIEPINFGAFYFYEPDLTGHRTGPYSLNMTKMVRQCDEYLGYLLDKIDESKYLRENLNLIVTSDHGMEQINGTNNPIYLEDYVDRTKIKAFGIPPVMNIFLESKNDIEIILKNLSKIPHSKSYKRENIPDRYHYKTHERIGDILLVLEPGYEVYHHPSLGGKQYNLSFVHGNHGYDNQVDSMKGIFYASGPEFKRNFTLEKSSQLNNVDIFDLMCFILKIDQCPSSNGTFEHVRPFLIKSNGVLRKNKILDQIIHAIALFGLSLALLVGILWTIVSFFNKGDVKQQTLPITSTTTTNTKHSEYQFNKINNPNKMSETEDEQS